MRSQAKKEINANLKKKFRKRVLYYQNIKPDREP